MTGTPSPSAPRAATRRFPLALVVVAILFVALAAWGIVSRGAAKDALRRDTAALAVPMVAVAPPKRGQPSEDVVLPGSVEAFQDTPIFARTAGYLKRWTVDIGQSVKAGDLLAEIDTPEVDLQATQARADLRTAQANYELAKTTAERWQNLLTTRVVARQDADEKISDAKAKMAALAAAQANVDRFTQLQSFKKIYAPFDGVITRRNTDVGALIDSGNGGTARELFHIAAVSKLRVYVDMPEAYAAAATPGLRAKLVLNEFPGREFDGELVRTANAIDPVTRTLRVEIDLDNPNNLVLPGSYAQVHLKLPGSGTNFVLPASSILFRADGLSVATLGDGDRVKLRKVVIGRDFGREIEIVSGLDGSERIVQNPPDSVVDDELVQIAPTPAPAK